MITQDCTTYSRFVIRVCLLFAAVEEGDCSSDPRSLNDELRITDELLKLLDDFRSNPYTAKQIEAKFGSQAFHLFGRAGVGPEVLQKFQKVVCYS